MIVAEREPRQVDIKRSLPDFVVWRWRLEDYRVCRRGEHAYNQPCPEHGCPSCFLDDRGELGYGTGEDCEKCDALTDEEYPDAGCLVGDDCPACERCPETSTSRECECKRPICRECHLCRDHVQKPGGYRGRPGRSGYPVDEFGEPLECEHSWRDPQTGLWS